MFFYKKYRNVYTLYYNIKSIFCYYFFEYVNMLRIELKKQILDPKKNIPIIIISFNQLFYLKQLIDFLLQNNFERIVIIDNKSSYLPLLKYYEVLNKDDRITIHYNKVNDGHRVFWKNKEYKRLYGKGYYVITDSDIVPLDECPSNFMDVLIGKLKFYNKKIKVGLSLKIDDIPNHNNNKQTVLDWESKFQSKNEFGDHDAPIDTTFAIYKPINQFSYYKYYDAVRLAYPFQAKHGGWYINSNNLTEEQLYYSKTANSSSSWNVNENGELKKKCYE